MRNALLDDHASPYLAPAMLERRGFHACPESNGPCLVRFAKFESEKIAYVVGKCSGKTVGYSAKKARRVDTMYLRFETRLDFPSLAKLLCPELADDNIDWDYENVYEWMYVDLPQLAFSLNVSREHGWADMDDEVLDQYQDNAVQLKRVVQPGPVYVFGWDRNRSDYVDTLPDFLSSFIADKLAVVVLVFGRRINASLPDGEPLSVVNPKHKTSR